ncbi:MAG: sigma-70 family RNA polymerase sigma factor [Planctomycetes bacterium]|nr:sigma-70 family RNA polymerase sigma factor [Planctomycetota bacterium]
MTVAPPDPTPRTLLDRLRGPSDPAAWNRFIDLYAPVVLAWVGHLGVGVGERADVSQDVFVRLLTALPKLEYDPSRRFRGWLFTVVRSATCEAG